MVLDFIKEAGAMMLGGRMGGDVEIIEEVEEMEDEDMEEVALPKRSSSRTAAAGTGYSRNMPAIRESEKVSRIHPELAQFKIARFKPEIVDDTPEIVRKIMDGTACIVNLEGVDKVNAQRIADFLAGASHALNGQIERINDAIFMIAPQGVEIDDHLKNESILSSLFPWKTFR